MGLDWLGGRNLAQILRLAGMTRPFERNRLLLEVEGFLAADAPLLSGRHDRPHFSVCRSSVALGTARGTRGDGQDDEEAQKPRFSADRGPAVSHSQHVFRPGSHILPILTPEG